MANAKKKFLQREGGFLMLMAIFVAAIMVFYDRPQIAMWIGFGLAGYSAIANDSIQTLGTFLSSNSKVKWWILWLYAGGILAAVLVYGWYSHSGDVSFGRLEKIAQPETFHYLQLIAPVALLILTKFKMPVSTTFLLLSVFTNSKTISAMLQKTFIGYFVAFFAALVIWSIVSKLTKEKIFFKENYNEKLWRVLQWFATAYLWSSWLMQDLANTAVYLPRMLSQTQMLIVVIGLFLGMGLLFYIKGGKIQQIITEKSDVVAVRSATIIDFVYGTILIVFKEWNNLPMSTTWVFLGLLAGREIALARFDTSDNKYLRTLGLVMKDLSLAGIGLFVSLVLAWLANGSFSLNDFMMINIFK